MHKFGVRAIFECCKGSEGFLHKRLLLGTPYELRALGSKQELKKNESLAKSDFVCSPEESEKTLLNVCYGFVGGFGIEKIARISGEFLLVSVPHETKREKSLKFRSDCNFSRGWDLIVPHAKNTTVIIIVMKLAEAEKLE